MENDRESMLMNRRRLTATQYLGVIDSGLGAEKTGNWIPNLQSVADETGPPWGSLWHGQMLGRLLKKPCGRVPLPISDEDEHLRSQYANHEPCQFVD